MGRRAEGDKETADIPPIVGEVLRSSGQPLDAETRAFMEPRFGHDFGRVRVHTGERAAEAARSVNSLAYTAGKHMVFGNGQYQTGTRRGTNLLAHELAHTIQQDAAGSTLQARLEISGPGDAAERDADAIATRIAQGQSVGRVERQRQQIARQPAPEGTTQAAVTTRAEAAAKEDPGEKRARAAKELVDKLKAAGATYKKENPRDWNNSEVSDCSKFVQLALEKSGEGDLFGRENARTLAMQSIIQKLQTDEKPPFRFTNPKVGDIMMWGGHVGIVYEVVEKQGTQYLVFAHMGTSGASLIGKSTKAAKDIYWLMVSDTAKIDKMGDGAYLGFWTPP